jgi:hypothetical protein
MDTQNFVRVIDGDTSQKSEVRSVQNGYTDSHF